MNILEVNKTEDQIIAESIEILKKKDPKIARRLAKLAIIAEKKSITYFTFSNMLDNYKV